MTSRRIWIGGNWKMMPGTTAKVAELVKGLNGGSLPAGREVVVAPTLLHLPGVASTIDSKRYTVAAQNCSQYADGAFTGEVSATQLVDFGVKVVILGHSERRRLFGETDAVVAEKVAVALKAGLRVVACLGETLEERKAGNTLSVVSRQLEAIARAVPAGQWSNVVLAYEPVWAIGTGVVATPDQAQEVHAALRQHLARIASQEVAAATRIVYGGSVKPDNCDILLKQGDVDGFLVGGASLTAKDFMPILNAKGKEGQARL